MYDSYLKPKSRFFVVLLTTMLLMAVSINSQTQPRFARLPTLRVDSAISYIHQLNNQATDQEHRNAKEMSLSDALRRKLGGRRLAALWSAALAGGRSVQFVSPGQSIQAAIDAATEGGWVFVLPGIYRETADSTNGLSDDIVFADNESRFNSIGLGIFVLPGLFDDRPGAKRITVRNNHLHDNNRENTAPPDSLPGALPAGTGILLMGADDSIIVQNRIENNNLVGVAVVDVCVAWAGTDRDCAVNPRVTPEFLADQEATNNRIVRNTLIRNGVDPPPSPFAFAASDLALLSFGAANCYAKNTFVTAFSIIGVLPVCP